MNDVILDLSEEEATRIVNDKDYQKEFIKKESEKLKSAIGNVRYLLFCPHCGEETLEGYTDRPFFFSCSKCEKTIFMTDKKIFDDMNKDLEETFQKEKAKEIKEAIAKYKHDVEVGKPASEGVE